METREILDAYEKFKKQYEKEGLKISFSQFDEMFYAESYFLNRTIPYLEKNFYVNLLQIIVENLKNVLHDLEYYVNLKSGSPIMQADMETLKDKNEEILKIYYTMHAKYKKHSIFFLNKTENSKKVLDFLDEVVLGVQEYNNLMKEIVLNLICNLEKKAKEISKEKKKSEFESSVYS